MKNKKTNFIYKSCILIYLISLVYAFYLNWGGKYFSMTIVACLTPFIMPLLMKLLKIEVPQEFYIINIIFVYFASLWGSCLGGYHLPYFDKFTHFFSGIIFCEIAYISYKHFLPNEKRKFLMFIFINALNAMIALFWEFYEYALLIFFNYDAINHYSTGIHDSITDMLVAVIGSFILSLYLTHYDQRNENHFFIKLAKNIKFNKTSHPN